jgi:hypothetical protein
MGDPIHTTAFYHDGRGPTLQKVHWDAGGTILRAIDYVNPNDEGVALKHVAFLKPQVAMVTPEEVIDYGRVGSDLSRHKPAAMFDLGRSDWLRSFAPRHLERCRHFQLFFYDELFEVLAEGVNCRVGAFVEAG